MQNTLIIKECPEEILIKLAIVLKISKSSRNIAIYIFYLQILIAVAILEMKIILNTSYIV
jgi:hypothetical protein